MYERGIAQDPAGSALLLLPSRGPRAGAPHARARRLPSLRRNLLLASAISRWLEPLERRLCLAGTISGTVFQDNNGAGTLDAGEPGLVGVTVYLDRDASGTLTAGDTTTTTAAGGTFSFTGLTDGPYSIGETTPSGFIRTGSAFQSATITAGNTVTGKNLGNFPTVMMGTSSSDSFVFKVDPTNLSRVQITATLGAGGGTTQFFVAKAALPSFMFNLTAGGNDQVTVDYTSGDPLPAGGLNFDGGSDTSAAGDTLTAAGGPGADTISIASLTVGTGGAGQIGIKNVERVTVMGAGGDDALTLGTSFAAGFAAGLFFDGGSNNDSLIYTGTDTADPVTLNVGSIVNGSLTHTYSQIETLSMNLLGGNDSVAINHTAASPALTLNLGDNDDTVTVSTATTVGATITGGNGDDTVVVGGAVSAPMSFTGGPGVDRLTVSGSGGNDVIHVGPATVFREGNVYSVAYSGAEELLVDAGLGNDAVDITSSATAPPVTVAGNDGADTLTVQDGPDATPVTYDGGNNTDQLVYLGTADNDTVTITASAVLLSGNPDVVTFAQTEQLIVQAGGGSDLVIVTGGSASTPITVLGGAGNDTVLQDLAATTGITYDGGSDINAATFIGTNVADAISVAPSSVTAAGKSLAFTNVQALLVEARDGADAITLAGSMQGTAVTLRGEAGGDTLTVSGVPNSAVHFEGGLTGGEHDTLNLNAGSMLFDADAAATTANLTLNVGINGTAYFSSNQHLERLDVSGKAAVDPDGHRVLVTTQLAVAGTIDLADNDLIVNYTGASPVGSWNGSAYTGVNGLVATGRSGGTWSGPGVTASGAHFQPPNRAGLGVSEASQALGLSGAATALWNGQTVDATSVLVKFTYVGDIDLNGMINGDDYFIIDSKVAMSGVVFGYSRGDLNFDSRIDGDDFFLMDLNEGADIVPL